MDIVQYISENVSSVLFLAFAALTVVAAFNVILNRNPIYCAIALIVVMVGLAAIFLTLYAQFIAAIQIIVYAGAIMVLFVFVIMLLNVRAEESLTDKQKYLKWLAPLLFLGLVVQAGLIVGALSNRAPLIPADLPPAQELGTVESIANAMFSTYLLPFEATSVLILMAIVGALLLAKRETMEDAERVLEAQRERLNQEL